MSTVQNSTAISPPLLVWYDRHARDLPWRVGPAARKRGERPDPYRVWLSEIMLQQTTVATVTPRYQRFLDLWPDAESLAAAPLEDVLAQWAGLGYYARARNLHKCAQTIVAAHDGKFPDSAAALQALPGIGPYTAAAIAAICFDEPAPVMDGNIERVMARLHAVETPLPAAKPVLRDLAAAATPALRPGDHAQALMDLGAMICTPRKPDCPLCPLRLCCRGHAAGIAAGLPRKARKKPKPIRHGTAFIIRRKNDGAVLLVRRPARGLLGGMLAPPTTEWGEQPDNDPVPPLRSDWREADQIVRHTFTHFHLEMAVWQTEITLKKSARLDGDWVADPLAAGLPTVFRKVFQG